MPKNIKRGKGGRAKPSLAALSGFASAKASTYDKQERKRKERALNSKVVNKYRKLKARLHATDAAILPSTAGEEQQPAAAAVPQSPRQQSLQPQPQRAQQLDQRQRQHDGERPTGQRPKHGRKPVPQLQRIAQEKEAERAEAQRLKEQKLQEAVHRKEEQARAQQRRKQQAAQFRKRTRTGQPVMKYRIDKVLDQLRSGKV